MYTFGLDQPWPAQSQPGYEALGLNEVQVTLTIRNNLNEVAKFLKDEKIIRD